MTILLTIAVFGALMAAMSIGVIVSERELRGSCGGVDVVTPDGEALSCGACPKKEATVCPSDEPLVAIAQLAHPNPKHHR